MKKYFRKSKNTLENKPLIIGITGAFGSGKSEAASFLQSKGFRKISLVQFLEEELIKKGEKNITRRMLQDLGNQWRRRYGSGVLAKRTVAFIKDNKIKKAVVDGFRNISEIEEFQKLGNFTLVGLVVNRDIRFKRLKNLKKREHLTREIFEELDSRDLGIGEGISGLQVAICLALSDIFIENNGSLLSLKEKIQNAAKTAEEKYD